MFLRMQYKKRRVTYGDKEREKDREREKCLMPLKTKIGISSYFLKKRRDYIM